MFSLMFGFSMFLFYHTIDEKATQTAQRKNKKSPCVCKG
jgi:uncharacterized membrane protein YeiB